MESAGGLLAGKPQGDGRRSQARAIVSDKLQQSLSQFEALADELALTPGNLALAWLLSQPAVVSVISGPGTVAQFESMLHVPDIELDSATLFRLDEIFPPCGAAPEAYAW